MKVDWTNKVWKAGQWMASHSKRASTSCDKMSDEKFLCFKKLPYGRSGNQSSDDDSSDDDE
eukprot:scaffold21246_cov110-Isochrysis_galbana.AAC.4